MTIHVEFTSDTEAVIMVTPGWLGRLFGARARQGVATRISNGNWLWKTTSVYVGERMMRAIEMQTVETMPPVMRVVRGGKAS